jgi:hypothetical protein
MIDGQLSRKVGLLQSLFSSGLIGNYSFFLWAKWTSYMMPKLMETKISSINTGRVALKVELFVTQIQAFARKKVKKMFQV